MRVNPSYHPLPPGRDATAADRLLHRLHVQMTMLEYSRPRPVEPVTTDMDSKSVLWRRCEAEWTATVNLMRDTGEL